MDLDLDLDLDVDVDVDVYRVICGLTKQRFINLYLGRYLQPIHQGLQLFLNFLIEQLHLDGVLYLVQRVGHCSAVGDLVDLVAARQFKRFADAVHRELEDAVANGFGEFHEAEPPDIAFAGRADLVSGMYLGQFPEIPAQV